MRTIRSATTAVILAAGLALGASAWAQQDPSTGGSATDTQKTQGSLSGADKKFLQDAYDSAQAQLQIGQLAADKGSTDAVKNLGRNVVSDEQQQLAQLKDIIDKNNVQVPQPSTQYTATITRLSKLTGPAFDRAFLDHERTHDAAMLGEFQREAKGGKNAALQSYASSQITVLRSHVDQTKKVGVTNAQPGSPQGRTNQQPGSQQQQPKSNPKAQPQPQQQQQQPGESNPQNQ